MRQLVTSRHYVSHLRKSAHHAEVRQTLDYGKIRPYEQGRRNNQHAHGATYAASSPTRRVDILSVVRRFLDWSAMATLEEVRHNAREAIELCIEVYQNKGWPVPTSDADPQDTIEEMIPVTFAGFCAGFRRSPRGK